LLVEVGKVKPNTIYVLCKYYDEEDRAELLKWEWWTKVLKAPTGTFGYQILNHYIPRDELRDIEELHKWI
jgi:hypothetical protein